ncbi:MAG: HAMP domain-containing sensor histidine kinase [Marinifilaceae bacterium]
MNKKTLNRIILFMSIALAILIALQSWWIMGSYKIYEQQVHKELDAALYLSINQENQIRIEKFKEKLGYDFNFSVTDEHMLEYMMNMATSKIYSDGSYIDKEKLKSICSNELRSRKIRSKFQFEIEDLFKGTKTVYPKRANYTPAATSIQQKVGSLGQKRISLTISNIDSYVYGNMKWSIVATAILVLFNAGCLFYMLFTIIRQKQVSEMRNDFVSNMTHEFKTPIATISAANEAITTFMGMGKLDRIDKYLDISKNETIKLNNLVEEILNISQYDKKDFSLKLEPVDIVEMIKEMIQRFKLKNEDFHFAFNSEEIEPVFVDRFHFQNTLSNLIDNAIKYSDTLKIVDITVYVNKEKLVVVIKDYGKGISKEQQKYIFDKFYRVSTGDLHQVKGFGLGLAYVRKIVEKHKGTINIKSQVGKGSEFFVYLPINQEISN